MPTDNNNCGGKTPRQLIQFSSVDYTGMLTVTDPGLFLQRLSQGYGKSRAFGCGLMLIKPGAEA